MDNDYSLKRTRWLVMATMIACIGWEVAYFASIQSLRLRLPSTILYGPIFRCGVAALVCAGFNWARISFIVTMGFGILSSLIALLSYYVISAQGAQTHRDPLAGHFTLLVIFPAIHFVLEVFGIWLLAFSEDVQELFSKARRRH